MKKKSLKKLSSFNQGQIEMNEKSSINDTRSKFILGIIAAMFLFQVYLFVKINNIEKKLSSQNQVINQNQDQQKPPSVDIETVKRLFTKDYISFGSSKNKVLIVEVSDASCPFCHIAGGHNPILAASVGERFKYDTQGGSYIPPVREIKKLVDQGKVSFAFLFSNGHGNGFLVAEAFYCAHEKGKFWEVHDKLMTNEGYDLINNVVQNNRQKAQELANFLAQEIDPVFLKNCLESQKYQKKVERDQQISPQLGFRGTPHFVINTTIFQGAYSFSEMKPVIEKNL